MPIDDLLLQRINSSFKDNSLTMRDVALVGDNQTFSTTDDIDEIISERISSTIHSSSGGVGNLDLAHMGAMLLQQRNTEKKERGENSKEWLPFPSRILKSDRDLSLTDYWDSDTKVFVLVPLPCEEEMTQINENIKQRNALKSNKSRTDEENLELDNLTKTLRNTTRPSMFSMGDSNSTVVDGRRDIKLQNDYLEDGGKKNRVAIGSFMGIPEVEENTESEGGKKLIFTIDNNRPLQQNNADAKALAKTLPTSFQEYALYNDHTPSNIWESNYEYADPNSLPSNELLLKYRSDVNPCLLLRNDFKGSNILLRDQNFLVQARIFAKGVNKDVPIVMWSDNNKDLVQVASMSPTGTMELNKPISILPDGTMTLSKSSQQLKPELPNTPSTQVKRAETTSKTRSKSL